MVTKMATEKYEKYFDEICKEDVNDVLTICSAASQIIYEKFKIKLDDPKITATIFSNTYEAILDYLESLEKDYSEFKIDICNRFVIGYSTNESEEDEKEGNFMIYIRHKNSLNTSMDNAADNANLKALDLAVQWNTDNVIEQPKIIRDIAAKAKDKCERMDIYLVSSECIMPIFITVYENIINYIKIRRKELDKFEFEINFASVFYIGAREAENDDCDIYIRPNIESKLKLKNDLIATAKHE
jgi:hypothetical protein